MRQVKEGLSCSPPKLVLSINIPLVRHTLELLARPRSTIARGSPTWTPDSGHWIISLSSTITPPIRSIGLSSLRFSWHDDFKALKDRPGPLHLVPIRLLLGPSFWKIFWSTRMKAKAITPWWRILQDCIGFNKRLHEFNNDKYPSPNCTICGMEDKQEDLFHFTVECSEKWKFWTEVVSMMKVTSLFQTQVDVWTGLISLSRVEKDITGCNKIQTLDKNELILLGTSFSTIWKYHWYCVIKEEQWNGNAVINMFKQDHADFIRSFTKNNS